MKFSVHSGAVNWQESGDTIRDARHDTEGYDSICCNTVSKMKYYDFFQSNFRKTVIV